MPRNHDRLIRQGQYFLVQRLDDLLEGSAGKVGAADAAREQRVSGNQLVLGWKIKANAAFGVSRRVQNIRFQASSRQRIRVAGALVNLYGPGRSDANPSGLNVHHLEQRLVVLIQKNGRSGRGPQLHRSTNMVDMRVGDNNLLDFEIVFANQRQYVFDIIAGINDHPFARSLIADDRAIALQRADGDDFMNHDE